MQLMSCDFAAVRRSGPAAWSGPRPSLMTAVALTKKLAASPPPSTLRPAASRRDDAEFGCAGGGSGRQVDEGIAVLRRRIHELRAAERGSWEEPPAWWVEPEEEERHIAYAEDDDVRELGAVLRALLVGVRPGVGVGLVAAFALVVPASAFVLVSHLLDASRVLISNLPH